MFSWAFLLLVLLLARVQNVLSQTVVSLSQADFSQGPVVISVPGTYMLTEDVVFLPNLPTDVEGVSANNIEKPELFLFPTDAQRAAFGRSFDLGFFAALIIECEDVILDLNGFQISQSHLHVAMQRFFAVIELTNSPFPPRAGPANFSTDDHFKASRNVTVRNGVIGYSAHHGIHCNGCENVVLENLIIRDFEVAGVSLNAVDGLAMKNIVVEESRRDVRYAGAWSQSIFLLQAYTLFIEPFVEVGSELERAADKMREAIRDVIAMELRLENDGDQLNFDAVSTALKSINSLFVVETNGLPDGSLLAGVLVHSRVNTQQFSNTFSSNQASGVIFENVTIRKLALNPIEQSALATNGPRTNDMVGGHFRVDAVREMNTGHFNYVGNVLSNLQIEMAQLSIDVKEGKHGSLSQLNANMVRLLGRNSITKAVIEWASGVRSWISLITETGTSLVSNRDSMDHFIKGVIGLKLDQVDNARFMNVVIEDIQNSGNFVHRGHFFQNLPLASPEDLQNVKIDNEIYEGFIVRGIAFSATRFVEGEASVRRLFSASGGNVNAVEGINENADIFLLLDQCFDSTELCQVTESIKGLLDAETKVLEYVKQNEFVTSTDEDNDSEPIVTVLVVICVVLSLIVMTLLVLFFQEKRQVVNSGTNTVGRDDLQLGQPTL